MNAKVMEIANEMLAEAGGDIGQEFQAATNTQLRAWAERLMEAAKEEGGVNRKLAREALKAALPWLADTCCEITKDARDALRLVEKALEEPERNCDLFGGDYKMLHTAWHDWAGSPSGMNANGTAKLTFGKWLLAPANKKVGET